MSCEKTLLLSCCAPCSCAVIEKLAQDGFNFAVYFYNPNISPREEYVKRRDEQARLCARYGVEFIEGPYEPQTWQKAVQGLESEPERGKRCEACFLLRLSQTANYASSHGFDKFSSVLGVSRYKDLQQVDEQARRAATTYAVPYNDANWRKGGLEERRRILNRELSLYNQTYCGCCYSQSAAHEDKHEKNS